MAVEPVVHQLAAAVRFVDIFTQQAVAVPLDVRAETLPVVPGMVSLPWRAVRGLTDQAYRFLVQNETVMPAGSVTVEITAPGGEYVNFEPCAFVLPRPLVAHPPTPARSDFLVQHVLWPTRSLRLPAGETAIVGRFISAGASPISQLKVTVWPDGAPIPSSPYTYSNDRGEFVCRLPELKTVAGGVISPTASLRLDVRTPPLYTTAVAPTQITRSDGAVLVVPFPLAVGAVTELSIALP